MAKATDQQIEQFISESFTSVWDLELLTLLIGNNGEALQVDEAVERLRASSLVVAQGTSTLLAAGLAVVDDAGAITFQPVSKDSEASARQAAAFYQRFPGRVRRLMIGRDSPSLTAFSAAFRLRKD